MLRGLKGEKKGINTNTNKITVISRNLRELIAHTYICAEELNRPLNYALIKQSLIRTDKEPGNLATIWKTRLSVREVKREGWLNPKLTPDRKKEVIKRQQEAKRETRNKTTM